MAQGQDGGAGGRRHGRVHALTGGELLRFGGRLAGRAPASYRPLAEAMLRAPKARAALTGDFTGYYRPTDDIFQSADLNSEEDTRPGLSEMEALRQSRVGIGYKGTAMVARACVRSGFDFGAEEDKPVRTPVTDAAFRWRRSVGFSQELALALDYERAYGVGMVVRYQSANDDLESPWPEGTPARKLQALPPTFLAPTNTFQSRWLGDDPDIWEFSGGQSSRVAARIHRSRIYLLRTRPVPGDWRGLSVFEPCWLSLMSYMSVMIHTVRGIAKWGTFVPIYKQARGDLSAKTLTAALNLLDQMQMNGYWVVGQDDELEFAQTQIGRGITEVLEPIKEDIASSWGLPMNELFGRSVSGGIGGEGALTAERSYLQTLADTQSDISDDVIRMHVTNGFDLSGLQVLWKLNLQRTTAQRLAEEEKELEIALKKEMLTQAKLQSRMAKLQFEMARAGMLGAVAGTAAETGPRGGAAGAGAIPLPPGVVAPADRAGEAANRRARAPDQRRREEEAGR